MSWVYWFPFPWLFSAASVIGAAVNVPKYFRTKEKKFLVAVLINSGMAVLTLWVGNEMCQMQLRGAESILQAQVKTRQADLEESREQVAHPRGGRDCGHDLCIGAALQRSR